MKNHNVMLLPLAVIGAIVVFCVVFAIVTGVPKRSKRPTISIPTSPQSIGLSREGVSETQPDFLRYGTSREDIRDAVLIDAVKDVPVLKAKYENERMRRLIREEVRRQGGQTDSLRYGTSREDIREALMIDAVKDVPVLKAKYENERMRRLIREELGR